MILEKLILASMTNFVNKDKQHIFLPPVTGLVGRVVVFGRWVVVLGRFVVVVLGVGGLVGLVGRLVVVVVVLGPGPLQYFKLI